MRLVYRSTEFAIPLGEKNILGCVGNHECTAIFVSSFFEKNEPS